MSIEVINQSNIEIESEEVGGETACFLGCAGSCLLVGGAVSAMGAVTTMV